MDMALHRPRHEEKVEEVNAPGRPNRRRHAPAAPGSHPEIRIPRARSQPQAPGTRAFLGGGNCAWRLAVKAGPEWVRIVQTLERIIQDLEKLIQVLERIIQLLERVIQVLGGLEGKAGV